MAYLPPGMVDALQRQYQILNQPSPVTAGPVAYNAALTPGTYAGDPFGGMKAGDTRSFNSFNANQVGDPSKGGIQVIGGQGTALGAMQVLMTQGASTEDAARMVGVSSAADMENLKARLLPGESSANVGLTRAQAGLAGAQTGLTNAGAATAREELRWIKPTRLSQISNILADTGRKISETGLNTDLLGSTGRTTEDYFERTPLSRGFGLQGYKY